MSRRVRADLAEVDLSGGGAIFEPVGRNTAAAVAIATLQTLRAHGDSLVLVVPSDHEISTDAQFWRTIEEGVPAALDGRHRGVRHQADAARDGLWLHRGGRWRRRCQRRIALRRKARPGDGRAISRRRQLLLEHRHLPVSRRRDARRVQAIPAGHLGRRRNGLRRRDRRPLRTLHAARSLYGRYRRPRSTMRSWRRRSASPWCRPASAGTTSAHGSRCSMSVRRTVRAT